MYYLFATPIWLFALLLLVPVFWLRLRRGAIVRIVPNAAAWHHPTPLKLSHLPIVFLTLSAILLILALARPQRVEDLREIKHQGYDLMLAIDLSSSMLAEDYERDGKPLNRLETIAPIIKAFINERSSDRIGVVVFAGRAYTLSPLTFNHAWLGKQVERLRPSLIEGGTAIGDGLGIALSRLKRKDTDPNRSRIGTFVILLSDGANNAGSLSPDQAAALAKERAIPVYTIGVGKSGFVPFPVMDRQGQKQGYNRVRSDLDEKTLRRIASETGGRYFRADATDTAQAAFKEIDAARKIEFKEKKYLIATELYAWFAAPALAFALAAALITAARHRTKSPHASGIRG
ncbi:MAG: VWA domain-containing protein [Puniceicoccales bacterium]|jgi:Ca-activated chloride channel family protein|nr:VWA domain-containing protein [Puniceicoccales bacterium]